MISSTLEPVLADAFLHQRPRVTARKGTPTHRVNHADAFAYPYVEPNVSGILQSLVIVDRDLPDADTIAGELGLLPPSWVTINPHTTTGHIGYALKDPVCITDAATRPPVNLLARIEHGLVTVLGGDPCYTGGLTKTPGHSLHATAYGPSDALYGLYPLATNLDGLGALPRAGNALKNVQRSAVGRNIACFDLTRHWAYRAVKPHRAAPFKDWDKAVLRYALALNNDRIANTFTHGPLPFVEVTYLARSVAKWVWTKYTPEIQSAYQARRGRKGGLAAAASPKHNALDNINKINTERRARSAADRAVI